MRIRPRTTLLVLVALLPFAAAGVPALSENPLDGYPEGSYMLEDGSIAVPLRQDTPAYYTPEIHRKVLEAGLRGNAYDAENDVELPVKTLLMNNLYIRPGAHMVSPAGCTMNFLYGTPGNYKLGSAGHCNPNVGTPVVIELRPLAYISLGNTVAAMNAGIGKDWSLTSINTVWEPILDSNVADIWGPQGGAYTGGASVLNPVTVKHFGHGLVIGTHGTPRAGTAIQMNNAEWYCQCAVIFGDSGGPILAVNSANPLGQGLGVVTHLVLGGLATGAGTRLSQVPATLVNGDVMPTPPP